MHSGVPVEPATSESSRQLLEGIMSTPTKERAGEKPANRRTWVIGVAAVAALVLAVAAGLNLAGEGGGEPLALNAPADDPMAICIAFSPEQLAATAELAFEGTVTAVDGDTVTLSVDQWYLGGDDTTEVVLNAPQGMEALIGGIPFEVGSQYLISAQDGTVNYCGFSGPATPELRSGFEAAFSG
jgi:hypothetical protein